MNTDLKRMLMTIGAILALLGLGVTFTDTNLPMPSAEVLIVMMGLVFGILLLDSVQLRRNAEIEHTELPEVEDRGSFPKPGAEANLEMGVDLQGPPPRSRSGRNTLKPRIREMAIDVLVRQANCTPSEAEELLDSGGWTDDPWAAGYFAGNLPEESLAQKLKYQFGFAEKDYGKPARRAIEEITAWDQGEQHD